MVSICFYLKSFSAFSKNSGFHTKLLHQRWVVSITHPPPTHDAYLINMARNWCFTVNDSSRQFSELDFAAITRKTWFKYMVLQEENGGEGDGQSTKHFQGYLECTQSVRLLTVKNILPGEAHLEVRQGTQQEARDYCMKEETRSAGPWEFGVFMVSAQGRRTDLHELARVIQEEGLSAAVNQMPWLIIRYPRGVQYY